MDFHFRNLLFINASLYVIAKIADEKHFLFRIPQERVFFRILSFFQWVLLSKKKIVIEIFQKGIFFLFAIFLFLEFEQVEFLPFVPHFMNNANQIKTKLGSSHILQFFFFLLITLK